MRKIFLLLAFLAVFIGCRDQQKPAETTTDPLVKNKDTTVPPSRPMQSEFADPKYTDMGKRMMKQFADGNIDAWGEGLADNAVYAWSGGDSLAGKKAIMDYWKGRRANVIESLQLSNDIWLPIKVNVPQRGPDMRGIWLLCWQQVNAKYRNGKSLQFWTHQDMHYNNDNKIDRIVMYMDRAPINAALGVK
jgi:hypothetical protein